MPLDVPPRAYLVTFTTYGTHLHGHPGGSVDRGHNLVGTPQLAADEERTQSEARRRSEPAYALDVRARAIVLASIRRTCQMRGWRLFAVHVRPTHVHVVFQTADDPNGATTAMKAHATRELALADGHRGRARWTRHQSVRYLWVEEAVDDAVHYVVHRQGEPMAVWAEGERA